MKNGWLSDLIGLIGIALVLLPWLLLDKPGIGALFTTCVGMVCAGISRADSLSSMLGKGNAGDEFLRDVWRWVRKWF